MLVIRPDAGSIRPDAGSSYSKIALARRVNGPIGLPVTVPLSLGARFPFPNDED